MHHSLAEVCADCLGNGSRVLVPVSPPRDVRQQTAPSTYLYDDGDFFEQGARNTHIVEGSSNQVSDVISEIECNVQLCRIRDLGEWAILGADRLRLVHRVIKLLSWAWRSKTLTSKDLVLISIVRTDHRILCEGILRQLSRYSLEGRRWRLMAGGEIIRY